MTHAPVTKEEREMLRSKSKERLENTCKARALIVATWLPAGTIACPVCFGKLHFTVARNNGDVHAQCETRLCLSWME